MGTIITETNSVDLSKYKAIIWKRHEEQLRARVEKEPANVAEDTPWELQGSELEDQELNLHKIPILHLSIHIHTTNLYKGGCYYQLYLSEAE